MTTNPRYHPRPERWRQFSLRGLLVLVTLAAIVTAWGVAEHKRQEGTPDIIIIEDEFIVFQIPPAVVVVVLGGLPIVGVGILLWYQSRRRR